MYKKLMLISIFFILTTSTVNANIKELPAKMITKINEYRMDKHEQYITKVFVQRYYRKARNLPKNEQIILALNTIMKRTEYKIYYHNPSDVVRGGADCQGYSIMFYLLMNKVNIPCKVIYNEKHMWNVLEGKEIDLVALDSMNIELIGGN